MFQPKKQETCVSEAGEQATADYHYWRAGEYCLRRLVEAAPEDPAARQSALRRITRLGGGNALYACGVCQTELHNVPGVLDQHDV